MVEKEANIYSIAYRDCKEVSDSIDANEEYGKASTILFYMDEILEALKIASELQPIDNSNDNLNKVAIHQVENHLLVELDKCNQARIKAIKENKVDSEVKMWGDMQIIYGLLAKHLETLK